MARHVRRRGILVWTIFDHSAPFEANAATGVGAHAGNLACNCCLRHRHPVERQPKWSREWPMMHDAGLLVGRGAVWLLEERAPSATTFTDATRFQRAVHEPAPVLPFRLDRSLIKASAITLDNSSTYSSGDRRDITSHTAPLPASRGRKSSYWTYVGFRPVRRVGAPPTPLRRWGRVAGVATGRTLPWLRCRP